jgi:hypothetical protein
VLTPAIGVELGKAIAQERREQAQRAGRPGRGREPRRVRRALGVRLVNTGLRLIAGTGGSGEARVVAHR